MRLWIIDRPVPRRRPTREAPRQELRLPLEAPRPNKGTPEEDHSAAESTARGVVDVDFYV
mgnify:CR=1